MVVPRSRTLSMPMWKTVNTVFPTYSTHLFKSPTLKKLPVTVRRRVVRAVLVQRLRASQGDEEKERGGVIRIFLSAPPASDETVKFLALARLSLCPPTCGRLVLAIRDFLHLSLSKCERPWRPVWIHSRKKWRDSAVHPFFLSYQIIVNRWEPIGFNFTRTSMWPLWFSVLISTCILNVGALRFTFLVLNIIYKWVHHIKLLCSSLSVLPVDMWVRVCHSAVYTCMFVWPYACGCVCLHAGFFVVRLPGLLSAPPPLSLPAPSPALSLTLTLFLSPFLYHPFTLPHPHPVALPPLPSAITVLT